MLLYFLALLCTVRAGLYRFSTATTPWEFRLQTVKPDTSWFPVEFFQEYELGAPDETGARPLLVDSSNGTFNIRLLFEIIYSITMYNNNVSQCLRSVPSLSLIIPSVVEKKLFIKKMSPICDDFWYDLEASEFCKMKGYRRGRRASVTTKDEFARTMLNCFDFQALNNYELGATTVGYFCFGYCCCTVYFITNQYAHYISIT